MKRILSFSLFIALCVMLVSCNGNNKLNIDDNNLEDMYNAYCDALENIIDNHILPDGTDDDMQFSETLYQNKFAVYDVDNDGKEELILLYTTTAEARWSGFVFAYREKTKELKTEFYNYPFLTFYDNGIIRARFKNSSERGADDFWAYSLYQYVPDLDEYVLAGTADAWGKNYRDDLRDEFPNDVDKSGTGVVYYIMKDGIFNYDNPIDVSEYNEWLNSYIGNASEIEIQYMSLTKENISNMRNK